MNNPPATHGLSRVCATFLATSPDGTCRGDSLRAVLPIPGGPSRTTFSALAKKLPVAKVGDQVAFERRLVVEDEVLDRLGRS